MDLFSYHLPSFASVIVAWAGVYGAFAKFDGDQSEENRSFVRNWLLGLQVDNQKWQIFFSALFESFFGKEHLSWKCARRSFLLSAGLIACLVVIWFARTDELGLAGITFLPKFVYLIGLVAASVCCGCVADYFSLWKTRVLLTRGNSFGNGLLLFAVLLIDFLITTLIFFVIYWIGIDLWFWLIRLINGSFDLDPAYVYYLAEELATLRNFMFARDVNYHPFSPIWILYCAALLTSAWLWIYLIVAYVMRAATHLPTALRLLSNVLDFNKHPVRTIGYAAATVSAAIVAIVTLV